MSKKLLVITAGTIAAGVGQTLLKQMQNHPNTGLDIVVRYIDTAYLPNRYASIRSDEWFQMSIDPVYMRALYKHVADFPNIERLLFPGLLPGTDVSGGGSIRYNGAGAVEVRRDDLRKWLSTAMTTLAQMGDTATNISVALIVSAVGATGSGSLEHLIDVIVESANFAGIHSSTQSTVRCDTYILQPSHDVTDLGLANTLALYAELAASQLSQTETTRRSYQGRKVMIGWGSERILSSIEQLKEVAATIIRLSNDPSTEFAAEFKEREVDNHVLRELDNMTSLPSHLSLLTAVTINLGRIEEQIIQRDVARLIKAVVFETNKESGQANVLLGKLADSLAGEQASDRYHQLLAYLSEMIGVQEMRRRLDAIAFNRGTTTGEKGTRLVARWQEYKEEIRQGRYRLQEFGTQYANDAIAELNVVKGERICNAGISLAQLREEYRTLHRMLLETLDVARADAQTTISDTLVDRQQQALYGPWPFNLFSRQVKIQRLANTMKHNLEEHIQQVTRSTAISVLEDLEKHCAEIGRGLEVVLGKLRRQQQSDKQYSTAVSRNFSLETGNPFNIVVLPNLEEMTIYADQVSIFITDSQGTGPLAEFHQWLQASNEVEELFKGNLERLQRVVERYVKEKVREAMKLHSVIDILQRTGEDALTRRLLEASNRVSALVAYDKSFAPNRREAWHVSAFYKNEQGEDLQNAINTAFAQGQCKLINSQDPAEIAIFYYVDGIPISAVRDLRGRCLEAFLKRRQQWHKQRLVLNGGAPSNSLDYLNQRVGVPIFSSQEAEDAVARTGVIKFLYDIMGPDVGKYTELEIPELGDRNSPLPQNGSNGHQPPQTPQNGGNGHQPSQAPQNGSNGHQPSQPPQNGGNTTQPSQPPQNGGNTTQPLQPPQNGGNTTQPSQPPQNGGNGNQP